VGYLGGSQEGGDFKLRMANLVGKRKGEKLSRVEVSRGS